MLAGFLFGDDQGVISGALNGIKKSFHPGTLVIEIITSWVTLGAIVGALVAGTLTERLGRRFTILLSAGIFVAGVLLESLAPGTTVLVVGRLVLGAGVGIASVAAPLYGAENVPARDRGRFVSLYQMAVTIGIFLADVRARCRATGQQVTVRERTSAQSWYVITKGTTAGSGRRLAAVISERLFLGPCRGAQSVPYGVGL